MLRLIKQGVVKGRLGEIKMRYIPFVTENCTKKSQIYSRQNDVARLAEKLGREQTIANWDTFLPSPVIKKNIGRAYRLIATQLPLDDDDMIIIQFLDVLPRGSSTYEDFLFNPNHYCEKVVPSHEEFKIFIADIEQTPSYHELGSPSRLEVEYLFAGLGPIDEANNMIYESNSWSNLIRNPDRREKVLRYYDLVAEIVHQKDISKIYHSRQDSGVAILYKRIDQNRLFLIAPLLIEKQEERRYLQEKYQYFCESDNQAIPNELLLKNSIKSYPELVLADEDLWKSIETNEAGNLSLSVEESAILNSVLRRIPGQKVYPLFINGRPGSGKSTILQYLFAEQLYLHLMRSKNDRLPYPPLYLTYSSKLLDVAKTAIRTILHCNSKLVVEGSIDLDTPDNVDIFHGSFGEFHRFLRQLISIDESNEQFSDETRIDFAKFRQLWRKKYRADPNAEIRKLSPELVWHIIRTYIKGMQDDIGGYLDYEAYVELPAKQKTVSDDTFRMVYERIWEGWYKPFCETYGYWDTQDLTKQVLNSNINASVYPAVFCDEAQDFTKNELEVILKLSLYSKRNLPPEYLKSVPFAFAGDPFQTLNPTGFDWDAVQANFHEKIVQGLDRSVRADLEFNYQELSYNYRSTPNIIRFCNLIQLTRGILFNIKNLEPQKVWFEDTESALPMYYDVDTPICRTKLEEQSETVIILPCQEGEEENYVKDDPLLNDLAQTSPELRNFLSPMAAKGLEFSRVVLYKFADNFIKNYPDLLDPLNNDNFLHDNQELSLPFQYYINRLYVAASRAQNRLLIVDTEEGINGLWERSELRDFEGLVARYNQSEQWHANDLAFVTIGREGTFDQDRDDPLTLAGALSEIGKVEKDTYMLRLASANYKRAGNLSEALLCDAIRFEIDGDLASAGENYLLIGKKVKALQCFWYIKDYKRISANDTFINTPEHRAAQFMQSNKTFADCKGFLDYLVSVIGGADKFILLKDTRWQELCLNLIQALSRLTIDDDIIWIQLYANLVFLHREGLEIQPSDDLAHIAYNAGEYEHAIDLWRKSSPNYEKNTLYHQAVVNVTEYPENLVSLSYLRKSDQIKALWLENRQEKLAEEHIRIVYQALEQDVPDVSLVDFIVEYTYLEERDLEKLINRLRRQNHDSLLLQLVTHLVHRKTQTDRWSDAIDFAANSGEWPKKLSAAIHSQIIRDAAISTSLPDDTLKERAFVGEYLRTLLIEKRSNIVTIEVAGAAIERAGKIIDSLEFYEAIWKDGTIEASRSGKQFARERWVKCKLRQAEYSSRINRKDDEARQLREANTRSRKWRIRIDQLSEYPELDLNIIITHSEPPQPAIKKQDHQISAIQLFLKNGWAIEEIMETLSIEEDLILKVKEDLDSC